MKTLNKVKTSIWINALSAIIIGILFLINPQESFQMITIIAGIIITATGILDFIYADFLTPVKKLYTVFSLLERIGEEEGYHSKSEDETEKNPGQLVF